MYSVLKNILSSALIALMMTGVVFQAAAEEAQTSPEEASANAVVIFDSEPSSSENASEAPEAQASEALEPQAEATAEPQITNDALIVEIPDEQVPLAGAPAPSVIVRANRDISALEFGDSLVLTCELSGFSGLEYAIRWQARVNGEWRDLTGEDSETLVIKITSENADWAYRAAVDAQPV